MNCLLDTRTLLWALAQEESLSPAACAAIESDKNTIHVSAVSFFEISVKSSVGKISFRNFQLEELPALLSESGVEIIPMDMPESLVLYSLPLKETHRDPFDRLLIAQAIERNLTLISSDKSLAQYCENGLSLLW
jgi:PIN domain nuclease of toxin-antitoxin system